MADNVLLGEAGWEILTYEAGNDGASSRTMFGFVKGKKRENYHQLIDLLYIT